MANGQKLWVPGADTLREGKPGLLLLRPGDIDCDSPEAAFAGEAIHSHWSDGRYLVHLQAFGQHELLSYSQQSSLGPRHWQIHPNHGWCIPAETSATQEKTS